jgi:hypothetical protein
MQYGMPRTSFILFPNIFADPLYVCYAHTFLLAHFISIIAHTLLLAQFMPTYFC